MTIRPFPACAALAGLALLLSGCSVTRTISAGAYRTAVADGTVAELRRLGITAERRPQCHMPDTGSPTVVRITCTGRTVTGQPIGVRGVVTAADTSRPDEHYVITVAGREVLRKSCLGLGCTAQHTPVHQHEPRYENGQVPEKPARHDG
ncbi:hypothetical protein SAMN04489712_13738 [Thermomonospora echinospora]|uniref:DUF4333 domain-containing protein n=1 Tax=Thermomonospora echinospora TaxID=1992 RepID=A0A1H6E8A9_9ACTN|nr:hypothetical protein [Thermomonospora echinospora]SEG93186.1 hypothetical protein SAMN04489712_13738 [Thermomonospora echinospora]